MTEKEMKEILEKQLRQLFEYSEKVGPVGLQEIIECEMKVINFLRGLENSQTESSQDDRFSVREGIVVHGLDLRRGFSGKVLGFEPKERKTLKERGRKEIIRH